MDCLMLNAQSNFESIFSELNSSDFNSIRFASYRTACKIRYIQKRTNLCLIDIWNAIEAIRENGLHLIQDIYVEIPLNKVFQLVQLLFLQLKKRLPKSQNVNIEDSISSSLTFLIKAFDSLNSGKVNAFSIKLAVCALCSGKLHDKLKYIYNQISDPSNGSLQLFKFSVFIKYLLQLACTVNESQFYQFNEQMVKEMFDFNSLSSLNLHAFNRLFFSESGPPPMLSWFVIMHKMAQVEFITHYTTCSCCNITNFTGFRYKCQKCFNYNLCENCFWQGKSSSSHNAETHSCKEYLIWKTTSKQIGDTLRKSFRLKSSNKQKVELNNDTPRYFIPKDKVINQVISQNNTFNNLESPNANQAISNVNAHFIQPMVNSIKPDQYFIASNEAKYFEKYANHSPAVSQSIISINDLIAPEYNLALDDEHRLIARYAANLANSGSIYSFENYGIYGDSVGDQLFDDAIYNEPLLSENILQYENKNQELMYEIIKLRDFSPSSDYNSLVNSINNNYNGYGQFSNSSSSNNSQSDALILEELTFLRDRKEELEDHLETLKDSRNELKYQIEHLINLSKNYENLLSAPTSANSTMRKNTLDHQKTLLDYENLNQRFEIMNENMNSIENTLKESRTKEKKLMENFKMHHKNKYNINNYESKNYFPEAKVEKLVEKFDKDLVIDEITTNGIQCTSGTSENQVKSPFKEEVKIKDEKTEFQDLSKYDQEIKQDLLNLKTKNSLKNINANEENIKNSDLDEKMMYNDILNRNIDLLLKKNTTSLPLNKIRVNKYEEAHKQRQLAELMKPTEDKPVGPVRTESTETDQTNNSRSNSFSSNSALSKFEVTSQPIMSFSSIAYVNANRMLNGKVSNIAQEPLGKLRLNADKLNTIDTSPLSNQYNASTSEEEGYLSPNKTQTDNDVFSAHLNWLPNNDYPCTPLFK